MHAENARGKSTLCAVLRSLRDADPNRVNERKTLDSPHAPHVKLLVDGSVVEFKDGTWTANCPEFEIFDADFITQNVYSGDVISHDHKRNLCRIVLGKEGVLLAEKVDELDDDERQAATTVNTARAVVQRLAPGGMPIDAFLGLQFDPQIDDKLSQTRKDIAVAENSAAIVERPALREIVLPTFPETFESSLATTIEGVSADAAAKVGQHIEQHLDGIRSAEGWLATAVMIADDGICPVCAQSLDNSPVFSAMQQYFSRAYRDFNEEILSFAANARRALSTDSLLPLQKVVADNAAHSEFWERYTRVGNVAVTFEDIQSAINELASAAEPLLGRKLASPLDAVETSTELRNSLLGYHALCKKVSQYNSGVHEINDGIASIKARAAGTNLYALQGTLALQEASKKRHMPESVTVISALTDAEAAKTAVSKAKEAARESLDTYNASVIAAYHDSVNDLLSRFGAGFKLLTVKVEYTGRTPRAAYTFGIRGKSVDPGTERTAPGTPCFRNTLSAGDRSSLALAFFVAQLKHRIDLANLVVVFDDPFTSLDAFRQH